MANILKVENLTKDFGNNKGIFDISFSIDPGEIVGFVGPNGAGKSTTINALVGNIKPDGGLFSFFGKQTNMHNIYQQVDKLGILLSETTLEADITPKRIFSESAELLDIKNSKKWREIADFLQLDTNKPVSKLSLGNRKKVGIVLALMHQPKFLIMDEPTSGLDPLVQSKFAKLLKENVQASGGAVLLSSHDLSEVQHICSRVIMIKLGKVIIDSPIKDLLVKTKRKFIIKSPPKKLTEMVKKSKFSSSIDMSELGLVVITNDHQALTKLLTDHKFYDFYIESPGLEEMFAEYYQ